MIFPPLQFGVIFQSCSPPSRYETHCMQTQNKHVAKKPKTRLEIQQPFLLPTFSFRVAHCFCI
jgi:hypothetical protein